MAIPTYLISQIERIESEMENYDWLQINVLMVKYSRLTQLICKWIEMCSEINISFSIELCGTKIKKKNYEKWS